MHLWSFMICGHSCRYWWFVRDGFGVQVRLRPRFHRRLAEPTEQLDDTLRRIWRSQSSICGRRLRRPGIVEDQVSVCPCDVILMSIQLFFITQVQFCHSMLCISILFHVIAERVQFYVLLEHLMNICFCFWHEKSRPMHYQVSILRSAVGRDWRNWWRWSRRSGHRGVFFGCVCVYVCVCAVSSC